MKCSIYELHYSSTNTYLIEGERGRILLDTGWAGTFPAFCRACGELGVSVQSIDYILITHFHPDHMGIAQEIADLGPVILVMDAQQGYIHAADAIFEKEAKYRFVPVNDAGVKIIPLSESREFLETLGISGEILHTPGHSDDSISLYLDEGTVFAGDLDPMYELELHHNDLVEKSWNKILERKPGKVYYGHAKAADLTESEIKTRSAEKDPAGPDIPGARKDDLFRLVAKIMKLTDQGISIQRIQKKTGADRDLIENVSRMYLTHQNAGVQGILDRIELRGKNL